MVEHPVLDDTLRGIAVGESSGWYIAANNRAGSGVDAVTHCHGGNVHSVGPHPYMGTDSGVVFVHAVVVHKDASCPNIGVLTHSRIAHIAEVRDFRAATNGGVFHFRESTHLRFRSQIGARTQVRPGSHRGAVTDHCVGSMGANHLSVTPHRDIGERAVRANGGAFSYCRGAMELAARQNSDIPGKFHIDVNPRVERIDNGDALRHPVGENAAVHLRSDFGHLHTIIDAGDNEGVIKAVCTYRTVCLAGDRNNIGEIEFALLIIGIEEF